MDIAEVRAELEKDRAWRQDEIRFFQNCAAKFDTEQEQPRFNRALILLLYAHFEGFCKFAFTLYINEVNKLGLLRGQANYSLTASSLSDLFGALRNPSSKCAEFKNSLPDDSKLHLFARDREFVERVADFMSCPMIIPETVVDTESNLKPVVLRKNLFRLGFRHDQFLDLEGEINRLLEYRNKIAHGAAQFGIEQNTYEALRCATDKIMTQVTIDIMEALQHKAYLRPDAEVQSTASV